MNETGAIALAYVAPYAVASLIASLAVSSSVKRLVWTYSALFTLLLGAVFFFYSGCDTEDFMPRDCPRVASSLEFPFGLLTLWLIAAHFMLSPITALVAIFLEWRARRARRQ